MDAPGTANDGCDHRRSWDVGTPARARREQPRRPRRGCRRARGKRARTV